MTGELTTRVVLADDHADMLSLAASTLRDRCDVVAAVGDGPEAVEAAVRLNPDVVVLDITMPGLDGFQTARELKRRGSRAKVVFLSLHEGDAFVVTGFQSGGQAFVPKPRMLTDLASAVDHVSAGRVFFPTLSSLSAVATKGGHAVMIYSHRHTWCDQSAQLVQKALTRGDAVTVLAPEITRSGITERLDALGVDTARAIAEGRYLLMDGEEMLREITRGGRPDRGPLAAMAARLEETRRVACGPTSRMTIIGEVAPCLGREHREEALSIERLWSEVSGKLPFLTVCGYAIDRVRDEDAGGRPWPDMCAEHWAVTQAIDA